MAGSYERGIEPSDSTKGGQYLTSSGAISLPRKTLFHEISLQWNPLLCPFRKPDTYVVEMYLRRKSLKLYILKHIPPWNANIHYLLTQKMI